MSLVKWPISPPSAQITTSRFTAQSKADNHDSVDALKNPLECINIRIREASEKSIPERGSAASSQILKLRKDICKFSNSDVSLTCYLRKELSSGK
jgi:hypothetical protein